MPDIRETEEPIPEEEEDMTAEDSEDSYGPETEILMPETETGEEDESGSDEKEEAEVAEEPTGNTEEIPETGEITETSGDEGAPTEEVTENPEPEAEKEILEPAERGRNSKSRSCSWFAYSSRTVGKGQRSGR